MVYTSVVIFTIYEENKMTMCSPRFGIGLPPPLSSSKTSLCAEWIEAEVYNTIHVWYYNYRNKLHVHSCSLHSIACKKH